MISVMIYGVIAIALAAAAGYAFLNFTIATKQTTYAQENTIRLEAAVSALRASLLALSPGANGGVVFAPLGVNASDNAGHTYMQLPASLGSIATAPWGQPYLYCPVSQTQTSGLAGDTYDNIGSSTVQSPSGASYNVGTYTGAATSNIAYVISNTPASLNASNSAGAQAGYVAFVVSALGPGQSIPDCSKIAISGTSITVPGGSVRAVAAGFPWIQRVVAASDRADLYVVPNGSVPATSDGTGRDANNPTTLDAALNLWQSLQPRQTNIYLASGGSFTTANTLNAEMVRAVAQGENTSLMIGTVPGATAPATVSLSGTLTLTTATSFINVNLNAASSLTAFKPLLLKNVTYTASTVGTPLSVTGTTLSVQNANFVRTTLTAINSTVEFYDWTAGGSGSTFVDSPLSGTMSRFSFDAQGSASYAFTTSASSTTYPVSMLTSSLNVSGNATLSVSNPNDNVYLYNSALTVNGTMQLSGGAATSNNTAGLDLYSGSSASIAGKATIAGSMPYGVFIRGSKLALDGTLTTSGVSGGAIGMSEGEFTGVGSMVNGSGYPCLFLKGVVQDPSNLTALGNRLNVPVYSSASTLPAAYAGYPVFPAVQAGYQPMVGSITNPTNSIDTTAAAYISPAKSPINDPQVYSAAQYAGGTIPQNTLIGYVDPATFERGVRDLVNIESVMGISLNFYGTCTP